MSHSNGKITAPVGIDADIAPVLGVSSYDLGYLCSNAHGKINPWARYKPVRYASLAPGSTEKWWKAWDGNCGVKPYTLTSYTDSVNHADGSMNGWEYQPPSGGNYPYRALDFDGYNHNAIAPISNFYVPGTAVNQFSSSSFQASAAIMMPSEGTETDQLDMSDFASIADCYFGIYAVYGNQSRRVTATSPIKNGMAMAEMKTYGMSSGTWTVYPFLCTAILEQDANDVANTCYSIPLLKSGTIEIISSYVTVTPLAGMLPSSAGSVKCTVTVKNASSSAQTFKNNYWYTRFMSSSFDDAMTVGESSGSIDTFTVEANSTYTAIFTTTISTQLVQAKNAMLWVSLNSGSYKGSCMFMVSADRE